MRAGDVADARVQDADSGIAGLGVVGERAMTSPYRISGRIKRFRFRKFVIDHLAFVIQRAPNELSIDGL
jgi:hypothetical protein